MFTTSIVSLLAEAYVKRVLTEEEVEFILCIDITSPTTKRKLAELNDTSIDHTDEVLTSLEERGFLEVKTPKNERSLKRSFLPHWWNIQNQVEEITWDEVLKEQFKGV